MALPTRVKVKVKQLGKILQNQAPVTIKGSLGGSVKSVEDIGDVDEVDVSEGSTLVYNDATGKYEVKKLEFADIDGDLDLDFGEF